MLCVALCVHWVRSYFAADLWSYDFSDGRPGTRDVGWVASNGAMGFSYADHPTALYPPGLKRYVEEPWAIQPMPGWRTFAFERRDQNGGRFWSAYLPHWFAALPFAVMPALWLFGWRRQRQRARDGRCAACGYDLRASSGRCPECGHEEALAPAA
jgi:hypothetical protein